MDELIELKRKYNALLERNSKAETYLNTHTLKEFMTKEFKGKTPFYGFCEIAIDLSMLRKEIEVLLYRNMTHDEVVNGFN